MRAVLMSVLGLAVLSGCTAGEPSATIQRDGDLVTGVVSRSFSDEELKENAFGVLCLPEETVTDLFITRRDDGSARVSARCLG